MKLISGNITSPKGFKSAAVHCGIKKRKLDFGLLFSDCPARAACTFTTNKLHAPHIDIDKEHIKQGCIQALLVNSGNANCYNGEVGLRDARALVRELSKVLKIKQKKILIASTGVIGERLPLSLMKKKMPLLAEKLTCDSKDDFAYAILTTDTKIKQVTVKLNIAGKDVVIAGCAKGAGMIYPHMATTLVFITTDANVKKTALQKALKANVDQTLNLISVEGDMSPNDTVVALANGLAKNKTINLNTKSFDKFSKALKFVLMQLSRMLIMDAEGATKILKIQIRGAKTYEDAKKIAFNIANSNLVKTAAYGQDPNWGRIVSSIGSAGACIKPKKLELKIAGVKVFKNFKPVRFNESKLKNIFKRPEILITVNLNLGQHQVTVLSCDLTREYININANYRT